MAQSIEGGPRGEPHAGLGGASQDAPQAGASTRSTGYPELDRELPEAGWPAQGLIELLTEKPHHGVIPLLLPGLAALAQPTKCGGDNDLRTIIAIIGAPAELCAPGWAALHVSADRLLRIRTEAFADQAWAVEQTLKSEACGAVVWWPGSSGRAQGAEATALRRLHLAAQASKTPVWVARDLPAESQSSPAPLRLVIHPVPQARWAVRIFKRRGMPMVDPIVIHEPPSIRIDYSRWQALTSRTMSIVEKLTAAPGPTLGRSPDQDHKKEVSKRSESIKTSHAMDRHPPASLAA